MYRMMHMSEKETQDRGCIYCNDAKKQSKRYVKCPYEKCPYHELDNITFREYLDKHYANSGVGESKPRGNRYLKEL